MSHMTILILRTILMYVVIFVTMRIMGKREIGKLSIFDLVISIMIAEIAVFVLEDIKKPIWEGLAPIVVLVAIQVGLAYIGLKNRKIRLFADGKPSVLVSRGRLHRKEMARLRYNLDDLMQQLRGKDIDSLADVEFAILETSGQLTVIPKDTGSSSNSSSNSSSSLSNTSGATNSSSTSSQSEKDNPTIVDIPYDKITYEGLPIPLILDGKVQDENLELIQKTRFWLKNEIQNYGAKDFKDIFLCSIDHKGRIYIDRKDRI
ncbi:YetF domain-containing protein [Paenibacillus sp. NPDC093718]|uniref:YetF domain-containing protein n=1 Tax=Paenibacillus sp. NPDC093718 TaxID=3390601 RepID=UPI003D052262